MSLTDGKEKIPMISVLALVLATGSPSVPPVFLAHGSGSEPQPGRIEKLADVGAMLAEPAGTIEPGKLVSLRQVDRPLPAWPREPQVILANGDRIPGGITVGREARVSFVPREKLAPSWMLPLSAIAVWWVAPPPADTPHDPSRYKWTAGAKHDTILLRNGDTATGTVESVTADGKSIRYVAEAGQPPRTVPLADVAAVAFDPALSRVRKPRGAHYRLVTTGGTRITLASATSDGKSLTGTTAFAGKASIPLGDVVALDVVGGTAVPLADLKGKSEVEGFNGLTWPPIPDRSVKGNPLRMPGKLGESWHDRGLGTHPKTTLTYPLAGKYRHFEATVGLDPVTGRRGTASIRILVDGQDRAVPGLKNLTAATSPIPVRLDISGAKELTLVIDFGPGGDVQADVNWADARVIE